MNIKLLVEHSYHSNSVSPIFPHISKDKASPFWKNFLKVGHSMSSFTLISVGNGKHTLFSEDTWANDIDYKSIFRPYISWQLINPIVLRYL